MTTGKTIEQIVKENANSKRDPILEKISSLIAAILTCFRHDEDGAIRCASIIETFFIKDCKEFRKPIITFIENHFREERLKNDNK